MRILHTNMLRGWGGQSNRILVEARGAAAAGHTVALAAPDGAQLLVRGREAGLETWDGFAFKPPIQVWKSWPDLRRLMARINAWKPDVIHCHGSQDSWLVGIARAWMGRACPPIIRSKHNIFPWHAHPGNRWLQARMDGFIGISDYIDAQVAAFPGLASKPHVSIRSVPDLARFPGRVPSGVRDELPERVRAGFVWGITARLRSEKAVDVAIVALAKLRQQRSDAYLVIAGDGSERAALEALAHRSGVGDAVVFLGFRKDVPEVLSAFDGYLLPSRAEGLGTAALEALSVGLPVIGSRVGGIPESVVHEQTGLLFESENSDQLAAAMARLMGDAALRERLAAGARAHIREHFTEEALVRHTLAFYERIVREARR